MVAEISSRLSEKRNIAKLIKEISEHPKKYSDLQKCSEQHKQQRCLTSKETLAYLQVIPIHRTGSGVVFKHERFSNTHSE